MFGGRGLVLLFGIFIINQGNTLALELKHEKLIVAYAQHNGQTDCCNLQALRTWVKKIRKHKPKLLPKVTLWGKELQIHLNTSIKKGSFSYKKDNKITTISNHKKCLIDFREFLVHIQPFYSQHKALLALAAFKALYAKLEYAPCHEGYLTMMVFCLEMFLDPHDWYVERLIVVGGKKKKRKYKRIVKPNENKIKNYQNKWLKSNIDFIRGELFYKAGCEASDKKVTIELEPGKFSTFDLREIPPEKKTEIFRTMLANVDESKEFIVDEVLNILNNKKQTE